MALDGYTTAAFTTVLVEQVRQSLEQSGPLLGSCTRPRGERVGGSRCGGFGVGGGGVRGVPDDLLGRGVDDVVGAVGALYELTADEQAVRAGR